MHQKLAEHGKCCVQNNKLPRPKTPVDWIEWFVMMNSNISSISCATKTWCTSGGYLAPRHNDLLLKRSPPPKAPPLTAPPKEARPFIVWTLLDSTTHHRPPYYTRKKTRSHTLGPPLRAEGVKNGGEIADIPFGVWTSRCPFVLSIPTCCSSQSAHTVPKPTKTKQNLDHYAVLYAFYLGRCPLQ